MGDLADPVGDEGQGVVLLGPGEQQRRQLLGDDHPLLAIAGLSVQAGVLHRHGRGLGEGQDGVGVGAGEAPGLVTQVEVAVDLPVQPQRGGEQTAGVLVLDGASEGRGPTQVIVDDQAGPLEPTEQGVRGSARISGGARGTGHLGELIKGRRGHAAAQAGTGPSRGGSGLDGLNIHVRVAEHGDSAPGGTCDGAGRLHQAAQRVRHPQGAGEPQGRLDEGDGRLVQARVDDRRPWASGGHELVGVDGVGQTPCRGGLLRRRRRRFPVLESGAVGLLRIVLGHTGKSGALRGRVCCVSRLVCRHRAQLVRLTWDVSSCCLSWSSWESAHR